ncbi:MAG: hypothetical protein OXG04_08355 [Acidobacteria bacterium]|nr:hypothetical protein [Acidobacteriota bacterium]
MDLPTPAAGEPRRVDKIVIECKLLYGSLERTVAAGLEQTAAYMDRCAASTESFATRSSPRGPQPEVLANPSRSRIAEGQGFEPEAAPARSR